MMVKLNTASGNKVMMSFRGICCFIQCWTLFCTVVGHPASYSIHILTLDYTTCWSTIQPLPNAMWCVLGVHITITVTRATIELHHSIVSTLVTWEPLYLTQKLTWEETKGVRDEPSHRLIMKWTSLEHRWNSGEFGLTGPVTRKTFQPKSATSIVARVLYHLRAVMYRRVAGASCLMCRRFRSNDNAAFLIDPFILLQPTVTVCFRTNVASANLKRLANIYNAFSSAGVAIFRGWHLELTPCGTRRPDHRTYNQILYELAADRSVKHLLGISTNWWVR